MSLTIWDKLATLRPTKDAAVANSGGDSYEERTHGGPVLVGPAPMRPFPRGAQMTDFTGRRFGDLVVLGIKAKEAADGKWRKMSWVCRCVCGNYAIRRHERLAKHDPTAYAGCPVCEQRRLVLARDKSSKGSTKKHRESAANRLDALADRERQP